MKVSELEREHSHFPSCDHDYQFIVTLSAIRDGKGDFISNELFQCCKCMKIGVVEQREIRW